MKIGHVKECHKPHNDDCPNNADARFDCTCKSDKKVERKPYREIKVKLRPEFVEHRMNSRLTVRLWPDGQIGLREHGRRRVYLTNVGKVYRGCVWREAMLAAQAHKAAKKGKKGVKRRRR